MSRVTLRIERVPIAIGEEAASDITNGFLSRPWHQKALCTYQDGGLTFVSENDFDDNGLATLDELSDEFCANVVAYEDAGAMSVVKIESF